MLITLHDIRNYVRAVLYFIVCVEMTSWSSNKTTLLGSGVGAVTRRETETETRRREIAAAEVRRRRWLDGRRQGDDDSFNRPDTPPQSSRHLSPPALYSLPTDSVILRHRRRCRAYTGAMATPRSSSSSSSTSSSDAGDGDDEADDRRTARHQRVTSRSRFTGRAKRAANGVSNRLVPPDINYRFVQCRTALQPLILTHP